MIRTIHGTVLESEPGGVTLDIAGLGILVRTLATDLPARGESATFATHLAIKQDGIELYGFTEVADRDFFELAISVSGIGPRKALTLLARAPREQIAHAIVRRDLGYLTRVAGLGKKSAEKMVLELSEKITAKDDATGSEDTEVFDTLVALGYTEREARKALAALPKTLEGKEARLRAALSQNP